MHIETSTTTPAEPDRLWEVMTDVEKWPEWIDVYQAVRRADEGPLKVGSRARVKQKSFAAGDWVVTELDEGRVFEWENRQAGVRTVGRHVVTADGDGTRLTLQLEQTGVLAGVVGWLMGGRIRQYVDKECERLAAVAAEHG
jgi:hypothetical protein